MSFFDVRLLITLLISSNFSYSLYKTTCLKKHTHIHRKHTHIHRILHHACNTHIYTEYCIMYVTHTYTQNITSCM